MTPRAWETRQARRTRAGPTPPRRRVTARASWRPTRARERAAMGLSVLQGGRFGNPNFRWCPCAAADPNGERNRPEVHARSPLIESLADLTEHNDSTSG